MISGLHTLFALIAATLFMNKTCPPQKLIVVRNAISAGLRACELSCSRWKCRLHCSPGTFSRLQRLSICVLCKTRFASLAHKQCDSLLFRWTWYLIVRSNLNKHTLWFVRTALRKPQLLQALFSQCFIAFMRAVGCTMHQQWCSNYSFRLSGNMWMLQACFRYYTECLFLHLQIVNWVSPLLLLIVSLHLSVVVNIVTCPWCSAC